MPMSQRLTLPFDVTPSAGAAMRLSPCASQRNTQSNDSWEMCNPEVKYHFYAELHKHRLSPHTTYFITLIPNRLQKGFQ